MTYASNGFENGKHTHIPEFTTTVSFESAGTIAIDTSYDETTWPLPPDTKAGYPLYMTVDGTVGLVSLTNGADYFGISESYATSGSQLAVRKWGVVHLYVGSVNVRAGDLVICEDHSAQVAGDIIPMSSTNSLSAPSTVQLMEKVLKAWVGQAWEAGAARVSSTSGTYIKIMLKGW